MYGLEFIATSLMPTEAVLMGFMLLRNPLSDAQGYAEGYFWGYHLDI